MPNYTTALIYVFDKVIAAQFQVIGNKYVPFRAAILGLLLSAQRYILAQNIANTDFYEYAYEFYLDAYERNEF
jgi:hypothetical protein